MAIAMAEIAKHTSTEIIFYFLQSRSTKNQTTVNQVTTPVSHTMDCADWIFTGDNGAPGRIRTSDRLVRSQVLYPAELRAHISTQV